LNIHKKKNACNNNITYQTKYKDLGSYKHFIIISLLT
jgi:hypothetical protein